jgi:hypothetical protein
MKKRCFIVTPGNADKATGKVRQVDADAINGLVV